MLAKSKLNSIETLTYHALIDLEISHQEFKTIVNKKESIKKMKKKKKYSGMMKSRDELNKAEDEKLQHQNF